MKPFAERSKTGITLNLYIQPGSSNPGFSGVHGDRLRIRVGPKAVDGAANKALIDYLARFFAVSKSSVSLLSGEHSRQKVVLIEGEPQTLIEKVDRLV